MSDAIEVGLAAAESALRAALTSGALLVEAPAQLTAAAAGVSRVRNLLAAVEAQLLADAERARLDGQFGTATVADVVADVVPVTVAELRRRARRAEAVTPRWSLTGQPLPAIAPLLGAAWADGQVSAEHADVVLAALDRVPAWCDVATVQIVESTLVQACSHVAPPVVARMGAQLIARLEDAGGSAPSDDPPPPDPKRGLCRIRRRDGGIRWQLDTDTLGDAALTAVLDPLSRPAPSEDGQLDPRTATQRRHDGLMEGLHRVLRSGSLPAAGGAPTTVLVTVTLGELRARRGIAVTDRGAPLPVPDLIAALGGHDVLLPAVVDDGAVLHLGRDQRLASPVQRRALAVRDRGCCFPGCDRPPAWCEAHHVRAWADGGGTDVENMVLLCGQHHRGFAANGWRLRMVRGVPEWIPPPWVDPRRRPVRNRAHPRAQPDIGLTTISPSDARSPDNQPPEP